MFRRWVWLWSITALGVLGAADLAAQDRQIDGTVVRVGTEEPVAEATVSVIGDAAAATTETDAGGRFSITAPAGEVTLRVSAFGYADAEIAVGPNQSTVTVELEYSVFNLDELVVTGQATSIERRSATTAVGYVSGEELNIAPASSMLESLTGKVTGVNLQSNSGAPGGGMQMQIRGNSTILGGFTPLYVVDGVIYSNASIPCGRGMTNAAASPSLEADPVNRIADLNPADIESIEVLKGAAASSIYGSKASNGVVVIETTRGQAGAPRINVTQRLGVFTPLRLLETRRWTEDEAVEAYGEEASQFFDGGGETYHDHYEDVFGQRDMSHETVATITGGNLDTRYFVSGTWKRDRGIEWNTGAGRQALRVNLDHVFSPSVDLQLSSAYNRSIADRGWNNNCNNFGCHGYAIAYIPSFVDLTAKNEDGTYPEPVAGVQSNPMQLAELGVNHEETNRFTGGATLTWNAIEDDRQNLRLVVGGGLDVFDQGNDVWTPNELFFERPQTRPGEAVESGGGSLFHNWNLNAVHDWNASGWSASTSVGLQYEDRSLHTFLIRTQNLLPGQRNVDQGTFQTAQENLTEERTLALYGQEAVRLLDERLLLQVGLRAERSSVNGDTDQYHIFPKVSGSYRFLDMVGPGSEVKLRLAYGETGNQPTFGQKFTLLGTPQLGGQQGFTVATGSGFSDIEPEREQEVEAGIDGTAFDDRLTWELTGFQTTTTNLLLQRVPAPSTGFATQLFNGGEIRNSGIEIGLGYTPILAADAHWIARGTFTRYTSEVIDLAGLPAFFPPASGFGNLGQTFVEEGKPITQIVGFDFIENEDGDLVRDSIQTQLGNTAPDFRVGLVNDIGYGPVNFNVVVDWQQGGDVINLTQFLHDAAGTSHDFGTDEWEQRYAGLLASTVITPYIEDGTFVKLRELAVHVDLPASVLAPLNLDARTVRVGLTGRNLLMWTRYSGLDPEVANFGSTAIRNNLDISPYPPMRSIFFNISVGI